MNPLLTVIKIVHITIIHFMQIGYTAERMLTHNYLTDVDHPSAKTLYCNPWNSKSWKIHCATTTSFSDARRSNPHLCSWPIIQSLWLVAIFTIINIWDVLISFEN